MALDPSQANNRSGCFIGLWSDQLHQESSHMLLALVAAGTSWQQPQVEPCPAHHVAQVCDHLVKVSEGLDLPEIDTFSL